MKFIKFGLENFRGISDKVEIDLNREKKKPVCLVGNNESGKTTILEGIALIGRLCKGEKLENGHLASQCRPKRGMTFSGKINLSADILFEKTDYENLNQIDVPDDNGQKTLDTTKIEKIEKAIKDNKHKISISFIYEYETNSFKRHDTVFDIEEIDKDILSNYIKEKCPDIIYLDDFMFDVPNVIRYGKNEASRKDASVTTKQNKTWQKIFEDILRGALLDQNPDALNKEPWKAKKLSMFDYYVTDWEVNNKGDDGAPRQVILGMTKFIEKKILNEWDNVSGLKSSFDKFLIDKKTSADVKFDEYSLYFQENGNLFSIKERSKGCRWFFCFKILTQIRTHRDSNNIIFLLDEPASNLHISPQDKILANLQKLAKQRQVIYSTHAPHLIDRTNCYVVNNQKIKECDDSNILAITPEAAIGMVNNKNDQLSQSLEPLAESVVINALPIRANLKKVLTKVGTIINVAEKTKFIVDIFK